MSGSEIMTLQQLKDEIERIINASPYSKEEVLSVLNAEEDLSPNELMAYMVALDYLHWKKGKESADYKKIERQFIKRKDKLMKHYL
jgi:hypothetical protein